MISGNPVSSEIERTGRPASASAVAVPPVEMISTPRSRRPRANSTIPVLSETDRSARAMRTSGPRATRTSSPASSVSVNRSMPDSIARPTLPLDHDAPRVVRVDSHRARRNQPHGLGQELVLDGLEPPPHFLDVAGVREFHGALEDDRAGIDSLIDEVNRDAEYLHAVRECL